MYESHMTKENVAAVKDRVAKLNAKAAKYGLPLFTMSVEESKEYALVFCNHSYWNKIPLNEVPTNKPRVTLYHVIVTGDPIKLGDYTVLGKVERHLNNIMFLSSGDVEVRNLWKEDFRCEHCNYNRHRNSVYLIHSEKDGRMQVGSTCLREYTGLDITPVNEWIKLMEEVEDMERDPKCKYLPTEYVLSMIIREISQYGYRSKKDYPGNNTAQVVLNNYSDPLEMITPEDTHIEAAKNVLSWARTNAEEYRERGEFWYNLMSVSAEEYFDPKYIGYLAYLPMAYFKEMDKREEIKNREKQKVQSEYVAEAKARIETQVTVKQVVGFDTEWGYSEIISMVDLEGNVLVWKTSTANELSNNYWNSLDNSEFNKDRIFRIKATVKGHQEYRGTKQTAVIRVKVLG